MGLVIYQGELFWKRKCYGDGVGESCRRESVSRRANRNRQSQVNRNLDGARIYLVERIAILRFCDDSLAPRVSQVLDHLAWSCL
jgi:hypothetical protein